MRFLGKRIRTDFSGEVVSRFRDRPEGLRIKHALDLNSVKLYDKQGSVLRVETTIQRAEGMRCYRPKEGDPNGPLEWRPLRRGIADLHRRAQLSQDSNERYLDALAACDTSTPLGRLLARVSQKTQWNGSTLRALRPWDARLIRILRAHRLVKKVPKTFRYRLTKCGQKLCSALLTANSLSLDKLHAAAA